MKQKGGIRILPEYQTIGKVIKYIIDNSTFEIFTENTTAGITILATLKPEFRAGSPCRTTRPYIFNEPVIKFLFKFSLWGEHDGFNRTGSTAITNITSTESLKREFDIQQDIFIKSTTDPSTLFEPLCPALVTAICNIKESIKNNIKSKILGNLKSRTRDDSDSTIIRALFENNISFMMMEFMEGYQLLTDLGENARFDDFKLYSLYELTKLHSYGYKHGDYHNSNVLINTKYPYFTNEENELLEGRAIIIDFGLSETIRITARDRVRNINKYEHPGIISEVPAKITYYETEFRTLDILRSKCANKFINKIREMGWDIYNLEQYDLERFNRTVLTGGLKTNPNKKSKHQLKEKTMARQPRKFEPWWSSHEQEWLALTRLHDALEKQANDKDYEKKLDAHIDKLVNNIGSNEEFQKMIKGIYTPPVFIVENSETQDELAALFEAEERENEAREKEMNAGGNYTSKKTKKPNSKRRKSIKNKSSKNR